MKGNIDIVKTEAPKPAAPAPRPPAAPAPAPAPPVVTANLGKR